MNNRVQEILAFYLLGVYEPHFYNQSGICHLRNFMQMQMGSEKGNDRNKSITRPITTMKSESVCITFPETEETHSVVCTVPPPPQASFSKDEEPCTHCPQQGAQEDDGLRGHRGTRKGCDKDTDVHPLFNQSRGSQSWLIIRIASGG